MLGVPSELPRSSLVHAQEIRVVPLIWIRGHRIRAARVAAQAAADAEAADTQGWAGHSANSASLSDTEEWGGATPNGEEKQLHSQLPQANFCFVVLQGRGFFGSSPSTCTLRLSHNHAHSCQTESHFAFTVV